MVARELTARAASAGQGQRPESGPSKDDHLAGGPLAAWLRDE